MRTGFRPLKPKLSCGQGLQHFAAIWFLPLCSSCCQWWGRPGFTRPKTWQTFCWPSWNGCETSLPSLRLGSWHELKNLWAWKVWIWPMLHDVAIWRIQQTMKKKLKVNIRLRSQITVPRKTIAIRASHHAGWSINGWINDVFQCANRSNCSWKTMTTTTTMLVLWQVIESHRVTQHFEKTKSFGSFRSFARNFQSRKRVWNDEQQQKKMQLFNQTGSRAATEWAMDQKIVQRLPLKSSDKQSKTVFCDARVNSRNAELLGIGFLRLFPDVGIWSWITFTECRIHRCWSLAFDVPPQSHCSNGRDVWDSVVTCEVFASHMPWMSSRIDRQNSHYMCGIYSDACHDRPRHWHVPNAFATPRNSKITHWVILQQNVILQQYFSSGAD